MLGEGSRLEGATISHSVIGIRSSVVGATLDHVLLMGVDSHYPDCGPDAPPVGVSAGSVIRNAIIDKNARIGRDVRIVNEKGIKEADGDQWFIRDGLVVIPKNAVIPDGTVI
jgi:glucose-1-phosphate adenylyltransferase